MTFETERLNNWLIEHAKILADDGIHYSSNWEHLPISPSIASKLKIYMRELVETMLDEVSQFIQICEVRHAHSPASQAVSFWNGQIKRDVEYETGEEYAALERASGTKLNEIAQSIRLGSMSFCREKEGSNLAVETKFELVVVGLLEIKMDTNGKTHEAPIMGIATIHPVNLLSVLRGVLPGGSSISDRGSQSAGTGSGYEYTGTISGQSGQESFQAVPASTQGTGIMPADLGTDASFQKNLHGVPKEAGPPSDVGSELDSKDQPSGSEADR